MGTAVSARRSGALCGALSLVTLALFCLAPSAGADLQFCPLGEGAGQCGAPPLGVVNSQRGLAVDNEAGRLYVADESNNRINVFEIDEAEGETDFLFAFGWGVADGSAAFQTCTVTCLKGIAGAGPGQFDRPNAIAVDNTGPQPHEIYVADSKNFRIQQFEPSGEFLWTAGEGVDKDDGTDLCTQAEGHTCGKGAESSAEGGFASTAFVAVGPGGVLYVVDNIRVSVPGPDIIEQRLQRFEASGASIPSAVILHEGVSAFALAAAADGAGNLWVTSQGVGLRKYCSPSWSLCAGPFEEGALFATNALAIDAGGDVLSGQFEVRAKGSGTFNVITAFDPATGDVRRRFAYTPFSGNLINGLAAHASGLGDLFQSTAGEGLAYVFEPPPGPVPAPPSLEVDDIGSTKAKLIAEVNPEDKATTVHFEYLTEKEWEEQGESFTGAAETDPVSLAGGATGFELKTAEELIGCLDPATEAEEPDSECLLPETIYRWRVVAVNADGEGPGPVEGPAFETDESLRIGEVWATGVGTDTAKLHAEVDPNSIPASGFFEYVDDATFQASGFAEASKAPAGAPLDFGAGEDFVTRSVTVYPLDPGTLYHWRLVADNPLLIEPVPSDPEELRTFAPPKVDPSCANAAARIGPAAFLPDCRAHEMVSPIEKAGGDIRVLETSFAKLAVHEQSSVSGERLLYGSVRSFGGAVSAPSTSQYLARRIAGVEWATHSVNPPRGAPILKAVEQFDTEFKAFSADLCEGWFESFAEPPLGPGALAGYSNLYRRTDELCGESGKPKYEALAPLVPPAGFEPGSDFGTELLGFSTDGEHAAFLANDAITPQGNEKQPQLYEHVRGEGVRLVCILPGGTPDGGSCTAGSAAAHPETQTGRISADGERIFWSDAGSGEGKLYVRIGGTQTVAVSEEGEEESGTSQSWFWGAGSDGSTAIFSTEPEPGSANLYQFDVAGEETEPIAEGVIGVLGIGEDAARVYFASSEVLSEAPNNNGDKAQAGKANLYLREAGGGIEFIATLADADTGQAVSRVGYLDHTALVGPDGAHATFVSVAPLTGYDNKDAESGLPREQVYRYDAEENELSCVSCNPSGARPAGRARIPFWQTPMHAARVLSADGTRLYFESADALAARDTNGKVDVYQWEEADTGGCDEADAAFSPQAGGCVELISSGQSPLDSRFVEASPSGNDAFFATASSLLPQDPGGVDVYDARVGGGLPIPSTPPPPCEGDACHVAPPAPEEPTPASADYTAPPEASAEGKPRPRCAKGKRRVTRKGKSRCVAKKQRRRRAAR